MKRWKRALAAALAAAGLAAGEAGAGERGAGDGSKGAGLVAEPEGEVRGAVVDGTGAPVAAVRVLLLPDPGGGEPEPGAVEGGVEPVARTITGSQGTFRIQGVEPGTYRLRAEVLGFRPITRKVEVDAGAPAVSVTLELEPEPVPLEGISVGASLDRHPPAFAEQARTAPMELDAEVIRSIPSAGEADPLRAVEILPGVISTSDLSASFNVRGGSADQNRVLLDGIPIYGPFHLGGLFSVFNADLVERTRLFAGDVPSRFQGGSSSVLEVDSDPGPGELQVDAGVSLLSSRAAVSGGVPEWAGGALGLRDLRWRTSFRRSYLDVVTAPFAEIPYRFHDVQGIVEGRTEGGGTLTLVGYTGGDRLDMGDMDPEERALRTLWEWGNRLMGVGWTGPWGEGKLDLRAGYTRFGTGMGFLDFEDTAFGSRVGHALFRMDYVRPLARGWSVEGGMASDRKAYENRAETGGTEFLTGRGRGWMAGGHGTVRWRDPARWVVELGGRMDRWSPSAGERTWTAAPRGAVKRFFLDGQGAVTLSAGRHGQFHHSLRDEDLPMGIDLWVLSGEGVPPLVAEQAGLGVEGGFGEGWFASAEGYVRSMDGVVSLNPAEDPNDPHDGLLEGRGRARGLDVLLRRDQGRLQGSLATSWLRATRTFPDPRVGAYEDREVTYPASFDRRLDVDLNVRFSVGDWTASVRWHLGSGLPYTRPEGSHLYLTPRQSRAGRWVWPGDPEVEVGYGSQAVVLGERNAARYPTYHRLDAGIRRHWERSWGRVAASVDVLNVYNQRNVLFYFYDFEEDPPVRSGLSMVPFLPSLGLEVRF